MHIKTGDKVQIMTGKDRGETGTVIRINRNTNRVVVEGVNIVKRHKKPGPDGSEGGIIEQEAFMDASNVLLYSAELERGVRTQNRYLGKDGSHHSSKSAASASLGGNGQVCKVRVCGKIGEVFE
jgi:large subunit ribosomal protein L24